jgi:NAD+ diphosphatase
MILPPSFVASAAFAATPTADARWFVFHQSRLLVGDGGALPVGEAAPVPLAGVPTRYLGTWEGAPCFAALAAAGDTETTLPYRFEHLRGLFNRVDDALLGVAGRAVQLVEFARTHRFCGACATPTEAHEGGSSLKCPACGETSYPRVAPAMMALIKRDTRFGRQLLLARGPRFPARMYSALAGFVEPSESLEECVHREAFEEVGVKVNNLRYFSSQGWPFPHSLMVAFVADWESGEIVPQEGEITDAQWFNLDALPVLPHRLSIARRLIDTVVAEVA